MQLKTSFSFKLAVLVIVFVSLAVWWRSRQLLNSAGSVAGANTSLSSEQAPPPARGMILPHHLLARQFIITSLQQLASESDYRYIVLVSPNHFYPEKGHFAADQLKGYPVAGQLTKQLAAAGTVQIDASLVQQEHGIMALLPYVHQTFPQAQVVPLVLSNFYQPSTLDALARQLNQLLPANQTLYLASIDFSHDNYLEPALNYNQETIQALTELDTDQITAWDNNHLDNRVGAVLLIKLMQQLGTTHWQTWHSLHGSQILNQPAASSTSYVIGVYR